MGLFDSVREKLFNATEGGAPPKIESVQDQPKEDIDLCGFVRGQFESVRSQANRISHEGIWMTNIAYLLGFDSVYYDPALRQYKPTSTDRSSKYLKRNRSHANLILPAVQNRTARMIKSPPKYEVRPDSDEQDSKDKAALDMEVINMLWDKQHINRKRIDLCMWLQECGHAYIKVSYDDQLGEPIVDPSTNELSFEGDIRVDVVSALEGFSDPLAKTFEECGWFGQAKVRKLDYFRSHYDRGDLVKQEDAWLLSAQYEMRINSLNSVGPSSSGTQEQMKNAAIELSYYEKRSKKHPMGRHIIIGNGVLLKNDELPYGEIPFSKFDDVVIGGKYNSESLITHARPLQDQYNRVLTKRDQWVSKLLAGKYIAAKGHGLIQEAINDQSGEVVEYNPVPGAQEPHAIQMPVMPSYVYQEGDAIKKDMYDIFGLSEVSRGILPSASIPAQGMQILIEQDETRIGLETEQHEHSWARVGKLLLKCAKKYYITPRTLKGKGKNLEYTVKKFTGDMLSEGSDVTVIRGSTVPNVKALERQEILNAFNTGLLGNPTDPTLREKVLGMLEFGSISEVWKEQRLDMNQIQKTIKMIENEEVPPVNKLDNHPMHIITKNDYRKSDKWDLLSSESQIILLKDIDAHGLAAAVLANPALGHPPDDGPPPELMMQHLDQQAQGIGMGMPEQPNGAMQ